MTSFLRQKPLKSKNKKHTIFWNTKFYHPAKFELKRIKNASSSKDAVLGVLYAPCTGCRHLSNLAWPTKDSYHGEQKAVVLGDHCSIAHYVNERDQL